MQNDRFKFKTLQSLSDFFCLNKKQRRFKAKFQKAHALCVNGDYEESYKLWNEITVEYQNCYGAFLMWGIAHYEKAKLDEIENIKLLQVACDKFEKAISIKPDLYDAYYCYGNALLKQGDIDVAKSDELYTQACIKFEKAASAKNDDYDSMYNWSYALICRAGLGGPQAEELYREVCEKCKKAVTFKKDDYAVYETWGSALIRLSQFNKNQEIELFQEAENILLKAENLEKGGGAYNLACLFALRNNEEECKRWLEIREEAGDLPTRKHAMKDSDLKFAWDKSWFKELKWADEK